MKKQKSQHTQKDTDSFYHMLTQLKNVDEVQHLITDLCTPAEIDALIDRWVVANLLDEDISYRKIQEQTGVSVTTVTRVARCLNGAEGGYRTMVDRLKKKAKL